MRLLMILLLPAIMLCAAAQPATKTAPKSTKKSKAAPTANAAPKPLQIPAGALKIGPNIFRHTDKAGKKWIYRNTPFGVMRRPDAPETTKETATEGAANQDKYPDVRAFEAGDSVRFERSSPFGPVKWEKKKTGLTEMERTVWERDQARAAQKD